VLRKVKKRKKDDIKDFTYFAEDYFLEKWRRFILFEPFHKLPSLLMKIYRLSMHVVET
jgi:hypothetical protein